MRSEIGYEYKDRHVRHLKFSSVSVEGTTIFKEF